MSIVNEQFECSVLICTYKPDWEKLRLTLKSVLMQEDCNYYIVVTDDGSEENYFDNVRNYFSRYDFSNYELIASPKNQGTTKNVLQGVHACKGELVKPLSPGDFLHGKLVLRRWVDFMRSRQECIMSFCDAIYYHLEKGKIVATKEFAHPQSTGVCGESTSLSKYLICNDICLGASSMVRRTLWIKYLEMIAGKVVYAEDNSYRIMMYAGEEFAYIAQSFLLYEYGTGISTNGNEVWAERLRKDWLEADRIMLSMEPCAEAKRLHIPEYLRLVNKEGWSARLQQWKWKITPSRLSYRLRRRVFPRRTPVNVEDEFVCELLSMDIL